MKIIAGVMGFAAGLLLLLLFSGVTLSLGFLNPYIEASASKLLNRNVRIQAPIRLKTSLHPELILAKILISNPPGWPDNGEFLDIGHGRGKLSLLRLLTGEIVIDELIFTDVDARFITRSDGAKNYLFSLTEQDPIKDQGPFRLAGIAGLHLSNIKASYVDESVNKSYLLSIDEARGKGSPDEPLTLTAQGAIQDEPYSLDVVTESLEALLQGADLWRLTHGQLDIAGATLDITATLDRSKNSTKARMSVDLEGEDLGEVAKLFDASLPEAVKFSARSNIDLQTNLVQLSNIEIRVLGSTLQGDIGYQFDAVRPTITAALSLSELEPSLFGFLLESSEADETEQTPSATAPPDAATPPPSDPSDPSVSSANPPMTLPWGMLKTLNADISVGIGSLELGTLNIENTQLNILLKDGDLKLPLSFELNDAPIHTKLVLESSKETPVLAFSFASESLQIEPLFKTIAKEERFSGNTGSVDFEFNSRGKDIQTLITNLVLDVKVVDMAINTEAGQMFSAENLSLEGKTRGPVSLSGQGRFLERPYRVDLRTGAEGDKSGVKTGLSLELNACDTKLNLKTHHYGIGSKEVVGYDYTLSGKNLCGLMASLEGFMLSEVDFYSSGSGKLHNTSGTLDLGTLRLGTVEVDIRGELTEKQGGGLKLSADIHAGKLDLSPFLDAQPAPPNRKPVPPATAKNSSSQKQNAEVLRDVMAQEILPHLDLWLPDGAIALHIEELDIGPGSVSNIRIDADIKKGTLSSAPFQATIAGELFTGDAGLDLTGNSPFVHFELATNDFHLPILMQEFNIQNAPDLTADHIELLLEFRGKTLTDMMQKNSQMLAINGGKWRLERDFGEHILIDIQQAEYQSKPGKPATITLDGHINSQPLNIQISEDGLFRKGSEPLNLEVRARLADTSLQLIGRILRNKDMSEVATSIDTSLSGNSMDSLNELLGINLPPMGPYVIKGSIESSGNEINFHNLALKIGDSSLNGEIHIETSTDEKGTPKFPIEISTRLKADSIQLDDFQFKGWSALGLSQDRTETPEDSEPGSNPQIDIPLRNLVSSELAEKITASLEVKVLEVLSGPDKLGSGILNARLQDGTYTLDTLHLDIPGGAVNIQGALKPEKDRILARLNMQIDHLDYGVLARRAQHDSDLKGEFNLKLSLNSEAKTPATIKQHLNGHFQFAVKPEEYKAGILDLWAVNILTAALPIMFKGSSSKVNCLAGDFLFNDGIITPPIFLLDTTRIRVEGKGNVNLKTNEIDFHLLPTPKSAHLFSAATPVSVSGSITSPDIGVSAGDVVASIFHMVSGIVTTPFMKVFSKSIEPDGKTACDAAMLWVHEPRDE